MDNLNYYIFEPPLVITVCMVLGAIIGGFIDYKNRSYGNIIYDLPSTMGIITGLSIGFALLFSR